ncbi:DUF924 family protein [Pararhodobacter sp. SW119]|uniref:DUF924 family protein n=1 Tax=Pararhodobacter sp. SW119 TaxID=2780075 RepID=UPI001AE00480|nr:DUF924 family protein [Pararhodobacter sp. SW119]
MPQRAEEIVRFWDEVGPEGWYGAAPELDAEIRARFLADWEKAAEGGLTHWCSNPTGALAYIIVTDQFPRNLFRDDPRAFATDRMARDAAMIAVQRDFDLKTPEPIRQFFYLPFMHAEDTFDQDRSVRLFIARMPDTGTENLRHARAHRDVIRRFGRFPYRNPALGRKSTPDEQRFLDKGGYGAVVRELA